MCSFNLRYIPTTMQGTVLGSYGVSEAQHAARVLGTLTSKLGKQHLDESNF